MLVFWRGLVGKLMPLQLLLCKKTGFSRLMPRLRLPYDEYTMSG